mmetsp:Transcript_24251/g.71344  ORF Transcript_24251/g.71344 Transcript_24251/m.71344 type:complete len:104 (-) Transcript_24251:182-493(-)
MYKLDEKENIYVAMYNYLKEFFTTRQGKDMPKEKRMELQKNIEDIVIEYEGNISKHEGLVNYELTEAKIDKVQATGDEIKAAVARVKYNFGGVAMIMYAYPKR